MPNHRRIPVFSSCQPHEERIEDAFVNDPQCVPERHCSINPQYTNVKVGERFRLEGDDVIEPPAIVGTLMVHMIATKKQFCSTNRHRDISPDSHKAL